MDRDELKRLCEEATPGKWNIFAEFNIKSGDRLVAACGGHQNNVRHEQVYRENVANAKFIAEARTALPNLLEENQRMARALDLLKRGSCWCEMGIGNPMVKSHDEGCNLARQALEGEG